MQLNIFGLKSSSANAAQTLLTLLDSSNDHNVWLFSDSKPSDLGEVALLRASLGTLLERGPHSEFREVVGDVALWRCLLTAKGDQKKARDIFIENLQVRAAYNLDAIRNRIEKKGMTNETLRHYDCNDFEHGKTFTKFGTFLLNAGTSLDGDPVFMWWMDTGRLQDMAKPEHFNAISGFVCENLVCS